MIRIFVVSSWRVNIYFAIFFILTSTLIVSSFDKLHFHRSIPKIELHAHLHGSIRPITMVDLARKHTNPLLLDEVESAIAGNRDLKKCFKVFNLLHELVSSKPILERIMLEALEDMMDDNIIYCELRTTPRALSDGTSLQDYIKTLTELTNQHNILNGDRMFVKLLFSIDRGKDIQAAKDMLESVIRIRSENPHNHIVGIDFSGNPTKNTFEEYKSILSLAREQGLKITVHAAELPSDKNNDPLELDKILEFR
jgi:adenosine deaminase